MRTERDELLDLLSEVVLGLTGRAANGITTVALQPEIFEEIRRRADDWNLASVDAED